MSGLTLEQLLAARPLVPPSDGTIPLAAPDAVRKPGFMAPGSKAAMIAGIIGDTLGSLAGRPAVYTQSLMQDRQRQAEDAQWTRRQQSELANQMALKQYEQAHPQDDEFTRMVRASGVDPASPQGQALYAQRIQHQTAEPDVVVTLPNGQLYIGPKSGLGQALTGGTAPQGPIGKLTPIDGGAAAPGMPPFGVSGARLDAITAHSESGGNPNAVSPAGARGLMQVMPSTAHNPGFGIRPSNGTPEDDVRVGQEYRRAMQVRYHGNPAQMWAAYNAGPGRTDQALTHGPDWLNYLPNETQNYVARNLRALRSR